MKWKIIHGEGDDPLLPGTYVVEAHGIKFDPPVKLVDVGHVIQQVGAQARVFVGEIIEVNKKLRRGLPKSGTPLRRLAGKVLEQVLDAHREETGETIIIVSPNDKKLSKENRSDWEVEIEAHKALVVKYCSGGEAMPEGDLNRALMVQACENLALISEKRCKVRSKIVLTPVALWAYVRSEQPHMDPSCQEMLLPTLVSEGWVLYQSGEEINLLPYGKGVPGYNKKECAPDHPAWSKGIKAWDL